MTPDGTPSSRRLRRHHRQSTDRVFATATVMLLGVSILVLFAPRAFQVTYAIVLVASAAFIGVRWSRRRRNSGRHKHEQQ